MLQLGPESSNSTNDVHPVRVFHTFSPTKSRIPSSVAHDVQNIPDIVPSPTDASSLRSSLVE